MVTGKKEYTFTFRSIDNCQMPADGHSSQEMLPLKCGLLGFLYMQMERQDIMREGVLSYVSQSLHRSYGNIFLFHGL
jgi:hypothetical protein